MSAFSQASRSAGLIPVLMVLAMLSGCETSDKGSRAHVEDLTYRLLPGGARILTGRLVNDGDRAIDVAQIEMSLFDDDNRRVSSMQILVREIAPGASKSFREPVVSDLKINGARVRRIMIL